MAATLQDLLAQIRGKQDMAELIARTRARKPKNYKLAKDILDNYTFPGDDKPKQPEEPQDT